jgi:hypothetical protein
MRKERPQLKLGIAFRIDEAGNRVEVNPQKDRDIANKCAAAIMTMETGIVHIVVREPNDSNTFVIQKR